MDHNIPLKTLLTYTSGITNKEILKRLPGGGDLVHILSSAEVTASKIDDVLQQHFSILQRSALKQAESRQVRIKVVILTYPNYLCPREGCNYFDKYIEKYLQIMRSVWGDAIKYQTASEGQAAAAYICSRFDDPVSTSREQRNAELFRGLSCGTELNLLVVDAGASTLV